MTPQQIRLVRESLAEASPQRNRLAGIFFAQLLAREPSLRFLFRADLRAHGRELHDGLAAIVASLDRLHAIAPALEWLAVRSARRGVGPDRYGIFVEALLAALAARRGAGLSPELGAAWRAAAAVVAGVMTAGLEAEPLAA